MYAYVVVIVLAIAAVGKTNNVSRSECLERGGTMLNDESCEICTSPNSCCTTGSDGTKDCHACSSSASSDQADDEMMQICSLWTCVPNDQDDLLTCSGCGSFLNGVDLDGDMICFDYTCETPTNNDGDTEVCVCNQVTYIGTDCGACSHVNGELIFDCSSLGGPVYAAAPPSVADPIDTAEGPTNTVAPTEMVTPAPATLAPTRAPVLITTGSPSMGTTEENDDPSKIPMDSEGGDSAPAPLLFQTSSATCLKQGIPVLSMLSVYVLFLWIV